MFGRGRRKARAAQAIEVQVDAPMPAVVAAPEAVITASAVHRDLEMDTTFMALMAQLDDSLAAMARACDRIEEAVGGASRHHRVETDTAAAA